MDDLNGVPWCPFCGAHHLPKEVCRYGPPRPTVGILDFLKSYDPSTVDRDLA